jgi:chromosome partitioning protein
MVTFLAMIITVASFKGGVGKTTTAVHLSRYLAKKGKTLLIDGDPNRSSLDWAATGNLNFSVIDERQAAKFARDFEHIVIDTKARPDNDDLKTLAEGCDLLVIPTTPDALSLKATLKMLSAMQTLNTNFYKILLTMIPPPPSHDGQDAERVLAANKLPIFKTRIRRYTAYKKAALKGVSVAEVKDHYAKAAWQDYENLGKEIIK